MKSTFLPLVFFACTSCTTVQHTVDSVRPETSSYLSPDERENPTRTWTFKNRKVSLHLGPSVIGDEPKTASYYLITPSKDSSDNCSAGSYISKEDYSHRGRLIEPAVHFSPSGNTVLIDEEVSDASPLYQVILVYFDSHLKRDWIRHISLPAVPTISFPERAIIISITDGEIFYRFPGDKKVKRVLISEVPDDIDRA